MFRIGSTTWGPSARATPAASKSSFDKDNPNAAETIDPPDTLEMRSSVGSCPSSLSLHSEPRWKSMARYPPPERHSATPSWGWPDSTSVWILSTGSERNADDVMTFSVYGLINTHVDLRLV